MSTRNVPPWYGVSDGPVFKRHGVYNRSWSDERTNAYTHQSVAQRDHFPRCLLGKICARLKHLKRESKERERDEIFVPVMVPRMCANESPTSSTDTPEALSEAISRSSFDKRLVSM